MLKKRFWTTKNIIFTILVVVLLLMLPKIIGILMLFFGAYVLACALNPYVSKLMQKMKNYNIHDYNGEFFVNTKEKELRLGCTSIFTKKRQKCMEMYNALYGDNGINTYFEKIGINERKYNDTVGLVKPKRSSIFTKLGLILKKYLFSVETVDILLDYEKNEGSTESQKKDKRNDFCEQYKASEEELSAINEVLKEYKEEELDYDDMLEESNDGDEFGKKGQGDSKGKMTMAKLFIKI